MRRLPIFLTVAVALAGTAAALAGLVHPELAGAAAAVGFTFTGADGSQWNVNDDTGDVTSVTDAGGNTSAVQTSPIVSQFTNLFTQGIQAVLNARIVQPAATQSAISAAAAQASINTANLTRILLYAAAAAIGYKLLVKS